MLIIEILLKNKNYIIVASVFIIISIICYNVFSPTVSDQRGTSDEVKSNIRSTGNELNGAGQAITNIQSISREIRRTNQNIEQSNQSIRQSVETSQSINQSSHDLTREGKQILRDISTGN